MVSLTGHILSVTFLKGHNNDQGSFRKTHLDTFLEDHELKWLADRGYTHHRLVTPTTLETQGWNNQQKGLRSLVEVIFGFVRNWAFASDKARLSPELQAIMLMVAYQLTEMMLQDYPLSITTTIKL